MKSVQVKHKATLFSNLLSIAAAYIKELQHIKNQTRLILLCMKCTPGSVT